jgi:pSer/pThr/pTyr-binding forkhead associated (FHA) protein
VELLIRIANLVFILGLYRFLHRAVALVWKDVRQAAPSESTAAKLIVMEVPDGASVVLGGQENCLAAVGSHIPIGSGKTIGRLNDNDIIILDPFASGHHAEVFKDGNRLFIRDLGSLNTTRVNARKLNKPHRLRSGDVIQIGETRLVFEE